MSKFTKDDVVVGATVTVRATYISDRYTDVTTYQPLLVHHIFSLETAFAADGGSVPIASKHPRFTVEILDVQPPKPEYVVGGIYPLTYRSGSTVYYAYHKDGTLGPVGALTGNATPDYYINAGHTIGDRVLVIDYPTPDHERRLRSGVLGSQASKLIIKALESEARS